MILSSKPPFVHSLNQIGDVAWRMGRAIILLAEVAISVIANKLFGSGGAQNQNVGLWRGQFVAVESDGHLSQQILL
jgi:hypothetical protein